MIARKIKKYETQRDQKNPITDTQVCCVQSKASDLSNTEVVVEPMKAINFILSCLNSDRSAGAAGGSQQPGLNFGNEASAGERKRIRALRRFHCPATPQGGWAPTEAAQVSEGQIAKRSGNDAAISRNKCPVRLRTKASVSDAKPPGPLAQGKPLKKTRSALKKPTLAYTFSRSVYARVTGELRSIVHTDPRSIPILQGFAGSCPPQNPISSLLNFIQ